MAKSIHDVRVKWEKIKDPKKKKAIQRWNVTKDGDFKNVAQVYDIVHEIGKEAVKNQRE